MSEKYNRVNWAVSILVASLSALPLGATAAGLGKLTVLSALGQPLRAELDVSASRDEMSSLSAKVAAPEAFRQANIEYSGNFSTLRFTLDKRPNGQPYFKLTSDRAISDPFMDVLIELNWPAGRLMREYTFLLDPPEAQAVESVASPVTRPTVAPFAAIPRDVARSEQASTRSKATPKVSEESPPKSKTRATESAAPTNGGDTRLVRSGDTLVRIAAETKPADVNLDQMLVALFRANPDAFDRGNMNRLRAGKILSVPSAAVAAEVAPAEARKEVRAHSGDFDAYKRKLAGMAKEGGAAEAHAEQSVAGRITPKVEEKAPAAVSKDKLEVSRTESVKSTGAAKAKAAEEEAVAHEKAMKEAQSRIAELEKNVAEMKRLVELKSQAAADLQKNAKPAEVAKAPVPAVPPPVAAPVKAPESPKVVEAPKDAVKPVEPPKVDAVPTPPIEAKPAEAAAPVETAKPAEVPKQAPKPKPVVVQEPEEEPGFIEENLPLLAGGGGVLALLAGYLGFKAWRRRKGESEASSSLAESALAGSSVFTAASSGHGGITDLTGQVSEFGPMADAFGAGEGVDPVREAETYLAYGRDVQAEEILLDALKRDPGQPAVHLKLLEIYASRKSVPEFNTIASELRSYSGGHGPDWIKAAALGREVDPSNPLYGADAVAPLETADTLRDVQVPAPVVSPEVVAEAPPVSVIEQATRTVVIPAPGGIAAALEKMSAPVAEDQVVEDEAPEKLDFDLDLSSTDISGGVGEMAEGTAPAVATDAGFDLDLGEPAVDEPVESVAEAAVEHAGDVDFDILSESEDLSATAGDAMAGEGGNVVDFDLALPEVASEAPVVSAPIESSGLDFNFDLGEPALAMEATDAFAGVEDGSLAETLIVESPSQVAEVPDLSLEETLIVDSIKDEAPASLPDISLENTFIADASDAGIPAPDSGLEDTLIVPDEAPPAPASSLPAEFADIDLELTDTFVMPAAELTDAKSASPTHAIEPENPEAATKLELAQAYEEMGDKEGARELLQEVIAEGSSSQKTTAQDRLARLD